MEIIFYILFQIYSHFKYEKCECQGYVSCEYYIQRYVCINDQLYFCHDNCEDYYDLSLYCEDEIVGCCVSNMSVNEEFNNG